MYTCTYIIMRTTLIYKVSSLSILDWQLPWFMQLRGLRIRVDIMVYQHWVYPDLRWFLEFSELMMRKQNMFSLFPIVALHRCCCCLCVRHQLNLARWRCPSWTSKSVLFFLCFTHLEVSENRGTPNSSILVGIFHSIIPIETPIETYVVYVFSRQKWDLSQTLLLCWGDENSCFLRIISG